MRNRRYLFESLKNTKILFIYAGGFQPFGFHHKQVYDQFLNIHNSDVVITSAGAKINDAQENAIGKKSKSVKRDYFNFSEKQKIIHDLFNINKNSILNIKNNYQMQPEIEEYLHDILNENDVILVWIVGEKDSARALPHLPLITLQELNSNTNSLNNRVTLENNNIKFDPKNLGYMLLSPNITGTSNQILSASEFRNTIQDPTKMVNEKLQAFQNYFNKKFNKSLQTHVMIFEKLLEKSQFDDFMKNLHSETLNEKKHLKNLIKHIILETFRK